MWRPLVDGGPRGALILDFDGTLAPIVRDPAAATPLAPAVTALGVLARRLGLVAIVSGRPVDFLRRHVPDEAIVVVGQYGLERDAGGRIAVDERVSAYEDAVASAAVEAERRWPALTVERKGRAAVTIHWRGAPDSAPSEAQLEALARQWGLACAPGRMACELRPPLPVDKGTTVSDLLADADVAVAAFAGDDHGDLAAFTALTEWAQRGPGRAALRVAVAADESPVALVDAADHVVASPEALAEQLTALARALTDGARLTERG